MHRERKTLISPMNRREKILKYTKKDGYGVEIGPSHNPIAPKRDGYKTHIIDHLNREGLQKKYKEHGVDIESIEEVDFVWNNESYSELTGKCKHYDWIIASHVIEHVPDLIGFLNDCDSILKDDGVLSLAIPDKRFCFDHYRPLTTVARVIDNHLAESKIHSAGMVVEYFLNVVSKSGQIAWSPHFPGEYQTVHSLEDALRGMHSVINHSAYLDIHTWCFTPSSFRLMIRDLLELKLIPFKEICFYPTSGHEFFVTLGKGGASPEETRIELLERIESELSEGSVSLSSISPN